MSCGVLDGVLDGVLNGVLGGVLGGVLDGVLDGVLGQKQVTRRTEEPKSTMGFFLNNMSTWSSYCNKCSHEALRLDVNLEPPAGSLFTRSG